MPSREEIREEIDKILEGVFSELDHWDCSEECGHKVCLIEWRDELTSELLSYLYSQGVVIKVGEISDSLAQTASEGDKYSAVGNGIFLLSSERTSHVFKAFKDMGYVAVEPLIYPKPSPEKQYEIGVDPATTKGEQ